MHPVIHLPSLPGRSNAFQTEHMSAPTLGCGLHPHCLHLRKRYPQQPGYSAPTESFRPRLLSQLTSNISANSTSPIFKILPESDNFHHSHPTFTRSKLLPCSLSKSKASSLVPASAPAHIPPGPPSSALQLKKLKLNDQIMSYLPQKLPVSSH